MASARLDIGVKDGRIAKLFKTIEGESDRVVMQPEKSLRQALVST